MSEVLLRAEGLSKVFGRHPAAALQALARGVSKEAIRAESGTTVGLHDVSLDVRRGETFVVMGLSGSGKSTLVRLLNRLIEPSAGRVYLGDTEVTALDPRELRALRRERMSMVFQRFALLPHVNVLDNVAFGLRVRGVAKAERQTRASEWVARVGLRGFERALPHELSGGMQQRVGLARALCGLFEVLLLDEAFSALDPLIRREMQGELIALQRELGTTVVFITHDLDEALRLGDRIAILRDGRLVQVGSGEAIVRTPADAHVRAFVQDVDFERVQRLRERDRTGA